MNIVSPMMRTQFIIQIDISTFIRPKR